MFSLLLVECCFVVGWCILVFVCVCLLGCDCLLSDCGCCLLLFNY